MSNVAIGPAIACARGLAYDAPMHAAPDTRQPSPSPNLLAALLRALFDTHELRMHLAGEPGGPNLLAALPGPVASLELLTHTAAELLQRHGCADRGFFDRLESARPGQRDTIRKVRQRWLTGTPLEPGALWADRYRLEAQIGDGGVGCVWRAIDEQTGQIVALKVLHQRHLDNPRIRQRFYRGAQTLAALSHPAIVRVHGPAMEDGLHSFYVMEYIHGVTLATSVRERRYPTAALLDMALQIGDALSHVHQRGLLHRDVKPTNILISERKQARLIDFDLVTGDDCVAMTTEAVGSGLYMPPEAHTSDPRTGAYDVYSLARTIEFILRGREPTVRESDDVADINAAADVKAILRAALLADPQRRIAQMSTFCAALRAALAVHGVAPERPTPSQAPLSADPVAAPSGSPGRGSALASVAGHVAVNLFLAPPREHALLVLLLFIGPSIRVLVDRERNKYLTVLHCLWMALWVVPLVAVLAALVGAAPAMTVGPFAILVIVAAIGLGVHASLAYLRRPDPR